jgi:hypothetical protein
MKPHHFGILISAAFIGLLGIVALINTMIIYHKQDGAQLNKSKPRSLPRNTDRRSVKESNIIPNANLYIDFGTSMDPNTIFFKNDPKFPDHGFITCSDTDRMYLIQCPSKGWTGSAHQEVYWKDEEPTIPDDTVRLYVFNNCARTKRLVAVGENVPETLRNGINIPSQDRVAVDLKIGFEGTMFSQVNCRDSIDVGNCDTCSCITGENNEQSAKKPFACSLVDLKVDLKRKVRYRLNNMDSFTTSYILSPGDKMIKQHKDNTCQASGGATFFTNQQILNQCPEELAFKDEDGVVITCLSLCNSCKLDNLVKSCHCTVDDDCKECTIYTDSQISDYNTSPPLKCVNNRCRTKLTRPDGRTCDTIVHSPQGNFTYKDIFCCNGLSQQLCQQLNGNEQ